MLRLRINKFYIKLSKLDKTAVNKDWTAFIGKLPGWAITYRLIVNK